MASVQNDQNDDNDDDEDEEADFEPGDDDDDDDNDEFCTEEQDEPLMLHGTLSSDADGTHLTYKGNTSNGDPFSFHSCKHHLHWDPSQPINDGHNTTTTSTTTRSIPMEGGIDTAKKSAVTLLIESSAATTTARAQGKSTGESDGEDNDAKPTATTEAITTPVVYNITATASNFSFSGTLSRSGDLNCVYDRIYPGRTVATTAAASKSIDTDEEDVDADEGISYDELIALHQDAGKPVELLRKRNHESSSTIKEDENKRRRLKTDTTELGDDDDDDEEFEGF